MMHVCNHCVVHCMDFRIQPTIERLLNTIGVEAGDYDHVSVAGGAGNFGQLREHLRLSNKLHDAGSFVLTVHEDCGAGATREDLAESLRIAREVKPDCKVGAYYVKLDGSWEQVH